MRLPFPLAVEPIAELAHRLALGLGQTVVVDGDSKQSLFLPAVAFDLVRVAAVTAIALGLEPHAAQARMLEGASGKRWPATPAFGATGSEVLAGAAQVRGRARHLRFNDPTAANAAEILRTALVGYGATLTCGDEQPDTAFANWATAAQFAELEGEIIDSLATDGEALIVLRTDERGALRLQHVPAEQLDESHTVELGGGRYIAAGIEYDADDQPVAYHFRPARPTDQYQTFRAPVRVDAADVLHLFRRQPAKPSGALIASQLTVTPSAPACAWGWQMMWSRCCSASATAS